MGHEIPGSESFTGLSRKVLEYSEAFARIVERLKEPDFSNEVWAPLEALVDVDNFVRQGVFLTDKAETIGWQTYKSYITKYGGATHWEATLRHITEGPKHIVARTGGAQYPRRLHSYREHGDGLRIRRRR